MSKSSNWESTIKPIVVLSAVSYTHLYYQGDHSPNEAERLARGYSSAWLHHKGRNKHHLESVSYTHLGRNGSRRKTEYEKYKNSYPCGAAGCH